MRSISLFLFLLINSSTLFGQNKVIGEWYSPVRNKFLKITVKNDSIYLTKQKFNLNEKSVYSQEGAFKIEETVNDKDNISFIVSEIIFIDKNLNRDSLAETGKQTQYKIITFSLDTNSNKNKLAIFSLDSNYKSKELAVQFLEDIPDNFQSISLYSKQSIELEIKKKEIKLMSLDEFKNYLNELIKFDNREKFIPKKKYKLNYVYGESTNREILSNLGFNSFFNGSEFDVIFKKYSDDSEVKKLMTEIAKIK